MTVALGIDTGGTYTDAVLLDQASGQVLAGAKALTTRHDLSVGIGQAVAAVLDRRAVFHSRPVTTQPLGLDCQIQAPSDPIVAGFASKAAGSPEPAGAVEQSRRPISPAEIDLVALSTTLATNAIVEGQGSPVGLLLIGYDPALIRQYGFERDLVTRDVVYLRGGHDGMGNQVEPLDEAAAREAILTRRDRVEAFAVSGYFGVRNPAHERRVRALVEELTGLPVTCGHELTTGLNAVRRATTAALNARLIPLLRELIATVRRTLDEQDIAAPLMIVKGDGSLVRAGWAMQRPIETVLSGPAASVVGAWHLAGRRDVWVVDVGGTTTDIAVLHDGRPRLNPEGAQVGQWRTMVEAVDVHTVGLGGDSQVCLNSKGRLVIGPRRVVPLCLLASQHPGIVDELRRQVGARQRESLAGQFLLAQCRATHALSDRERDLLSHLAAGPQALSSLAKKLHYGVLVMGQIESLEARGLVLRAGFTPTDALHVLGRFERWEAEASRLGAELLAAQMDLSPETFCERVAAEVSNRVTAELVSKVLNDEATRPNWECEPSAAALLARALGNVPGSDLDCQLRLRQPLVAVGAPVEAYLPRVASQLRTELVIPPHAEVANAVGAVAGGVVQQLRVMIRPLDADQRFRLHLPGGVRDFSSVEEGVAYAQQIVPVQLKALARQAGASQVEVQMARVDRGAPVAAGWEPPVYLGTELTFTAVGRPVPGSGSH